jgi:5-methylthioadenosine/S-adenosylhomocysteine deaminase
MGHRILLAGGHLIDHRGKVHRKNLLIEDGLVSYVGDEEPKADVVYNCENKYISPSFVNLHTHSPMNLFKGIAEDVDIDSWFNDIIWPYESKLEPEDIYHSTRIAAAEMIDNGVSAYADHYLFPEEIIRAVSDMGIKIDLAPTLFSVGGGFEEGIQNTLNLLEKYKNNSNIKISLGPHSPYTCTEEDLRKVARVAQEYELKIHIHVSETQEQVDTSLKEKGLTPIEVLYRAGCLNHKVIIAHGLYVTDEDIQYINDNVTFALSPKTYMKLNMGLGNILKYRDKVNISIGTDGAASSSTLDPLEQVRLLGLMGKFISEDSTEYSVETLWSYLMKGHEILEFNSGRLEEGYSADLIIWDLNLPNTQVNNNVLASIIYSANSKNIEATLISGKFVKENGKVRVDVVDSMDYCTERINAMKREGKGKTKLKF